MNKLKFFVFCPDDEKAITAIIEAASRAGAGIIGNYSHCAFITKGVGNFFPQEGAHPTIGRVGEMVRVNEVKIEMECPEDRKQQVINLVTEAHPYEEVVIDFVKLT